MNREEFRSYCLDKEGISESSGREKQKFKVATETFAIIDAENFEKITLKSEPQDALQMREQFTAVEEAEYKDKTDWITVTVNAGVPDDVIYGWVDDSYNLAKANLSKAERETVEGE